MRVTDIAVKTREKGLVLREKFTIIDGRGKSGQEGWAKEVVVGSCAAMI